MKSWIISVSEIYGSKTQNSSGEICGLKTRIARRWGFYFPDSCSGCRNGQPCRRRDAVGESPTQGGKSRRALAAHSTNCSDIWKRAQKWKKSTEIDRKLWCKTIKCLKDYRDKPNRVCYNTNKQTDTIWFSAGLYVIIRISIFINAKSDSHFWIQFFFSNSVSGCISISWTAWKKSGFAKPGNSHGILTSVAVLYIHCKILLSSALKIPYASIAVWKHRLEMPGGFG